MLDRIVFAHDNQFLRAADGGVYSGRGRWPWDRYLAFAESLSVISRMEDLPAGTDTSGLELSSHPRVSFVPVPSLSGVASTR